MAGINFAITGNPSGLIAAAQQSQKALEELKGVAENTGSSVDGVLSGIKSFAGAVTGIGVGVIGLQRFAASLVSIRSEFQDTEAKLKVFLKSEQAAKDMMEELEGLAWNNVFEFTDITKAAAQLLAYKTEASDVGDTINRLSEIAAGTGTSLDEMVMRFNKVKATNTLDSQMQQSLANIGIDIKGVIAEIDGLNRSDLDGITLNFNDLQRVITHLTDEGGMFFGMMKERGKNISDSIAGVRDNFALMMNEIGEYVQTPIKAGIDKANDWIANWKEIAKVIGGAVVAVGSYKAALATIKGIKEASQKVSFSLETAELQDITKAANEQYQLELSLLEQQISQGTAARDADLQLAVAKGTLTEAQALEITRLREIAAEQVATMQAKAAAAQQEAQIAAQELANLENAQNAVALYNEEVDAINKKIAALGKEADERQLSTLMTQKATAEENLELATRKANTAQTQRQAVAEKAEAASKNAEAMAARADAMQQSLDAVGKKANEKQTNALTKAQVMLNMVMRATGLSMLANPYVLAAAAIAAACLGIYKLVTAESAAERATRKHNEALSQQQKLISQIQDAAKTQVSVLQNSNATDLQKQTAFNELKAGKTVYKDDEGKDYDEETQRIMNEAGQKLAAFYNTADAMAAASRDEVEQLLNQYSDEAQWELAKQKVEEYQAAVEEAQAVITAQNEAVKYGGRGATMFDYKQLNKANEELEVAEKVLSEIQQTIDDTNWNKLSLDEKKLDFEQNLRPQAETLTQELNTLQEKVRGLGNPHWWNYTAKVEKKDAEKKIAEIEAQLARIEDKRIQIEVVEKNDKEDSVTNVAATVKQIREWESAVNQARAAYAKNASDINKEVLEKAENTLGVYTKRYQAQTGKSWADSIKTQEEINKAVRDAANERIKIENSRIQAERIARKADLEQQLKEIEQQSREWSKSHNGRTNKAFSKQADNLRLQYTIDTEKADKQFAEWKADFEKATLQLTIEAKTAELQNAVDMSQTVQERIAAQNALYEHQIQLIREANQAEAEKAVNSKYGYRTVADFKSFVSDDGNRSVLSSYRNAGSSASKKEVADAAGLDEVLLATYAEMEQIYEQYSLRLEATIQQQERQHNADMLRQDIDDYTAYCEEVIAAAEWREQQLSAIASGGEKNRTKEMVEEDFQTKVQTAQSNHSIDAGEQNAANVVTGLVQSLADVTYDQIDVVSQEFYNALDEQVSHIQSAKGMTVEARTIAAEQTEQQVASMQTELEENPLLTDQQRLEIQNQLVAAEQQLVYLKMTDKQLDGELNKLEQTRKTMQTQVSAAKSSAGTKTLKEQRQEKTALEDTVDALGNVSTAAKAVGDTMGGALSKKASKAVDTIGEIADFGIQAIKGIQTIVSGVSTAMQATSEGASSAIRTVETASVILTIISIAIQLIMKIVEIASKYTESAKLQNAIDAQLEKVEELKRKNEELQRQYKSKVGTEYYKGMSKAAKDYNKIIAEQQEALREAEVLYQLQKSKYKDDSDKVKDAKAQRDEIEDDLNDLYDEQADMLEELRTSLLTTDLTSFSDSLADALVEGFENGKDGIEDAWEETLNDLMRAMMKQQLSIALQNMFKSTFDKMNAYADDGELTQSEIDAIVAEMDAKTEQAKALAETYYDLMDERGLLTDEDNTGRKGGFESMSQDTADELNARFTALQIEGANVVVAAQGIQGTLAEMSVADRLKQTIMQNISDNVALVSMIAQNQLDQLRTIADNTALLQDTNKRLKAIEQNTALL